MNLTDQEYNELIEFLEPRYNRLGFSLEFESAFRAYLELPDFNLNENIFEENASFFNVEIQAIVRLATQFYLTKTFQAMKINLDDPNTMEELSEGNIGTPGRLAKMWVGSDLSDSAELLSGRWTKPPRIASFPNTNDKNLPITKRVDLVSCCSHHIAPFSSFFREDAYAIISYIPDKKVLGISKLQRTVDWIARRGWLQEDLTKTIYEAVSEAAETDSVYVRLNNISHTCESLRGSQTQDGAFTTEYYGGLFNELSVRNEIKG
jgi:GTP cyclohydrolase I